MTEPIMVWCPTCKGWGIDLEAPSESCNSPADECECVSLACWDCGGSGQVEM